MHSIACEDCGEQTPAYDSIHCGSAEFGYRNLCGQCFNMHVASLVGQENFEHFRLDPISMIDIDGAAHEFHFRSHLFGSGVSLDAFELHDGAPAGHQFRVIGAPEEDLLVLLARLVAKMRRALAAKHIETTKLGLQVTDSLVVRGRVESSVCDDDFDSEIPTVVIDGREVTWSDFGRMLAAFEGWQFKLETRDLSDDF
jgi:hypothetical protein